MRKNPHGFSPLWAKAGVILLGVLSLAGPPVAQEEQPKLAVRRLGQQLFFDQRLSADAKVSCATCHQPAREFSDDAPVSKGSHGKIGTRNAPGLTARETGDPLFWDGRRATLESQVLDPFFNPAEHGLLGADDLVRKIHDVGGYQQPFASAFPDSARPITAENIAVALTAFVSSLPTNKSRVERYLAGDQHALTDLEKEGMTLFRGRAQCAQCHLVTDSAAGISDRRFHSVGIGIEAAQLADLATRALKTVEKDGIDAAILLNTDMSHLGRFLVTKEPRDIGKFKTPSLRHASITSPYMHDGSVATLEEALDRELYYRSLASGTPLALTNDERAQLLAFLRAL
jgi:cytochrome c peroxidase